MLPNPQWSVRQDPPQQAVQMRMDVAPEAMETEWDVGGTRLPRDLPAPSLDLATFIMLAPPKEVLSRRAEAIRREVERMLTERIRSVAPRGEIRFSWRRTLDWDGVQCWAVVDEQPGLLRPVK